MFSRSVGGESSRIQHRDLPSSNIEMFKSACHRGMPREMAEMLPGRRAGYAGSGLHG